MFDLHEIRKGVVTALAQTVDAPEAGIDLSGALDSLGVDSLAFLRLKLILEKTFGIGLPDAFGDRLATGEDVVAGVADALKSPAH
ncbi:acyl carrier protein [Roseomonas genomospecies 6]|uniref:Acyl carrier protein n=1 Tax=Roseomonas genomospecies 6 TaxID=214106 RepID=A0A9W7NJP5_9PROT|nr:acyl carrier protein [Roseomonas genomospecies 6]KAA0680613.1 acyl carrier protein [Roseomonas genomospecies 6]